MSRDRHIWVGDHQFRTFTTKRYLYYLRSHDDHIVCQVSELENKLGLPDPGYEALREAYNDSGAERKLSMWYECNPLQFSVQTRDTSQYNALITQTAMNELMATMTELATDHNPCILGQAYIWNEYTNKRELDDAVVQLGQTLDHYIRHIQERRRK